MVHSNVIDVDSALASHPGFNLHVQGEGNTIKVASSSMTGEVHIHALGHADIRVGANCVLGHLMIYASPGARVHIGRGVGFNGSVRLLLHEPNFVSIGDGCLFAGNVDVTCSDMHSIIDLANGMRINPPQDVMIHDRVWLGQNAMVLKGAKIGAGSIIGANSVVTGPVPENSLAVGSPARVVRSGCSWRHELL